MRGGKLVIYASPNSFLSRRMDLEEIAASTFRAPSENPSEKRGHLGPAKG